MKRLSLLLYLVISVVLLYGTVCPTLAPRKLPSRFVPVILTARLPDESRWERAGELEKSSG